MRVPIIWVGVSDFGGLGFGDVWALGVVFRVHALRSEGPWVYAGTQKKHQRSSP